MDILNVSIYKQFNSLSIRYKFMQRQVYKISFYLSEKYINFGKVILILYIKCTFIYT